MDRIGQIWTNKKAKVDRVKRKDHDDLNIPRTATIPTGYDLIDTT
jgi:hypothetical protein